MPVLIARIQVCRGRYINELGPGKNAWNTMIGNKIILVSLSLHLFGLGRIFRLVLGVGYSGIVLCIR